MPSDPVDLDLVRTFQSGDTSAFRPLVDRHGPGIFGFFARALRNEALAEELFQETFLRCYRNIGHFRADAASSDFRIWLYRLAVNLLRDQLRRAEVRRALEPVLNASPAPAASTPEADAALSQLRDKVRDALPRLPDVSREVLILHYYRGFTHAEIGLVLGIPTGTVKSRMRIAVDALRELMPLPEPS